MKRIIGTIKCFQDTDNDLFSYCLVFLSQKINELFYLKQTLRNTNQKQQSKNHLQNLKCLMTDHRPQFNCICIYFQLHNGNMEKLTLRSNVVHFHRNKNPLVYYTAAYSIDIFKTVLHELKG